MSEPGRELAVVPSRQLDRVEASLESLHAALDELNSQLERFLFEQVGSDAARLGFRSYRRRLRLRTEGV